MEVPTSRLQRGEIIKVSNGHAGRQERKKGKEREICREWRSSEGERERKKEREGARMRERERERRERERHAQRERWKWRLG